MTAARNQALAEAFAELGRASAKVAAALLDFDRDELSARTPKDSPAAKPERAAPAPKTQRPLVLREDQEAPEGLSKTGRKISNRTVKVDRATGHVR